MYTRRQILGSAALAPFVARGAAARPNVLVFMTDQESGRHPGAARLPNRERLERTATVFTEAFCNTPQCSPARASLMTGLSPHRAGVRTNVDGNSLGRSLPAATPTVGQVFRSAGYTTGYFGKWHLSVPDGDLRGFGFDHRVAGSDAEATRGAVEWLRGRPGPWLGWVSLLDPHHIYDIPKVVGGVTARASVAAPASGLENLEGKPRAQREFTTQDQGRATAAFGPEQWRQYRSYYLDLLEKTDQRLGEVLDAIDLKNTIVLYTSDHGDQLGEHGLPFKGPFMYDELLRIPLTISAPGRMRPGRRQDLATSADVPATLADLAGVDWPNQIDGISLRKRSNRDAIFLEYYAKQKWVNPIRTIRTRRHKLNAYQSGERELYDLVADPHEIHNLAAAEPALRERLEASLDAWWRPEAE